MKQGPEALIPEKVPVPQVRPGWSLIRIRAFGLNHSEIFTRQGLSPSATFPRILGIECTGEIAETTDPERLPRGQKVASLMGEMGRAFDGSYAEYALVPNGQIYPVASNLPWEKLAAIPETGYTTYGSIQNLKVEDADHVLVRGATSSVGIAAARLLVAAHPALDLAGTTRNLAKDKLLRNAGYRRIIEDRDGVLQTDERFDKVLELIGPATLRDTFAHISEGGICCCTGELGGQWYLDDHFDPIMDLPANGYLTSFCSGNVDQARLQALFDEIARTHADLGPAKVFPFSELREAHAWLGTERSGGKAVVVL